MAHRPLRMLGSVLPALMMFTTPRVEAATCKLEQLPEIPVTMQGLLPTVHARINGIDALFVADSGALFNFVTPAAVQEFQLHVDNSFRGLQVEGVGGSERAQVARAKTFEIADISVPNVPFVVAGSGFGGAVGLLGQNLFHVADVEYDLANGVIRLARPKDCKDRPLAYWAAQAKKAYSVIDIALADVHEPHTKSVAYLNGTKIRVLFDTGSPVSTLTLDAARRAGITPSSPGAVEAGPAWGFGHRVSNTWIAPFASFKLGDEEVEHAKLRFGDISLVGADMLIGADFFLSHRIYVASSQGKLYFTYNGGPVFDLTALRAPAAADAAGSSLAAPSDKRTPSAAPGQAGVPASSAGAAAGAAAVGTPIAAGARDAVGAQLDRPTDAAGYARRGAASAARHNYEAAIADLTRACELAPAESAYFYQRGLARSANNQADLALADFDQAIRLKPDFADSLLARASLRSGRHDAAASVAADLDATDRALPKEADARLGLGSLYEDIEQPAAAVVQYTKWIDSHPRDDLRMPVALNARCWARALTGQTLDLALADCNSALRMRPNTAAFLDSRALVYLRQANYDKAIADYDAALRLQPKLAWSLYGRGLARLHKGITAEAETDIAAATALEPKIADIAREYGITP